MAEFYIEANSFAAPFFSDTSRRFQDGDSAEDALLRFAEAYEHPSGLYSAVAYADANARAKGAEPLASWHSNHAQGLSKATAGKGGHTIQGLAPGKFKVGGVLIEVDDPKGGGIVAT